MVLLKKFFESGRTMVEMLAVLGVLGVIAGGGTYGFAYAMDVFKSWSTQTQIANFSKGIEDLYGWRSDYKDVSMTGNGGICNNASAIMNTACEGDVFKSNWGGSLYAQPAAGGQGYKIILTDVPVRACKMLADMHWERVRLLDTSCNANRQTLTFVSYMQSECNPECSGNQTCKGGVCVCANGGIGESCDIVDLCETMNCEGVCRTGECVNGRCETVANGTSCEGGRCFDGECVECISSDDCPECQACVGNVCRNRADGEVCSEGVCLNGVCGTADLCADVVCEETCSVCNPSTGACEAAPDGTACGEDRTCSDGVCVGSCSINDDCGINGFCADSNSSCLSRTPTQCTGLNGYFARKTITLSDNTTETWYVSNGGVSWWDADAACTAAGLTMATVNDLIDNWNGTTGTKTRTERAQRLYDAIGSYYVWTSDIKPSNSCFAFAVTLSNGFVYNGTRSNYTYLALCRADLCTNVTCGECNICNPVTGACEVVADGIVCSGGVCTSGMCIVEDTVDLTCSSVNDCHGDLECLSCSGGECSEINDGNTCTEDDTNVTGVCSYGYCQIGECNTNADCGAGYFCGDQNKSGYSETKPGKCQKLDFVSATITVNDSTETWFASKRKMSWWDAKAACSKLGKSLATRSEIVARYSAFYTAFGNYSVWTSEMDNNYGYAYNVFLSGGYVDFDGCTFYFDLALCH